MSIKQREAIRAFDEQMKTSKQRSLAAVSNLNVSGTESLVGLLKIVKDKVENSGAGYPPDAETDVRSYVDEVKKAIAVNATKWIVEIERVTDENYAQVARDNGIVL